MRTKEAIAAERKARNKELADSVRDGTYVDHRANTLESWYPIRPKIRKNQEELKRLYEGAEKSKVTSKETPHATDQGPSTDDPPRSVRGL